MRRKELAWHKEFETWGDFVDMAESKDSKLPKSDQHSRTNGKSFTGTNSMEEAIELARAGWIDGARSAKKLSSAMFDEMSSLIERVDTVYDVEGNGIDVARFVDGEPECWQKFESIQTEGHGNKIIRLVYNGGATYDVDKQVMSRKGAAVHAVVELLEYAGHRVEVVYVTSSACYGSNPWQVWVTIKRASEVMDPGRLAFALAHPAMLRRLNFSIWEQMGDVDFLDRCGIPDGGYGQPYALDEEDQGDIYIGESVGGGGVWRSDETAEAWVLDQLRNQGIMLTEEAARA